MAQMTAHRPRDLETRRERLRSTLPVLVAVALLVAVAVGGMLALHGLLDTGVWLLSDM
ncbi:MAG: hypothetical protein HGA44_16395 [Cellulomonadaceae bacterium]|nr:hypothetical protein [Cellulomonadaceae bacterium]